MAWNSGPRERAGFFTRYGEHNMRQQDIFTYPVSFVGATAVGPLATVTQTLTFDASSEFTWFYSGMLAINAAASTNITATNRIWPLATILITPSDTSAQFMQAPAPMATLFGTGEQPFVLPQPRIFAPRSALTVQITSLDTALTYNLFLSFIGKKKYTG
jgi:hypothetical protein